MKILDFFNFLWKDIFIRFIRLFFVYLNGGSRCIVCGNICYVYPVCSSCLKNHFAITEESFNSRCSICGKELISTKDLCPKCREEPILKNCNKVIPIFSYRLWNKELLFLWKINGIRNLSYLFASFVNKTLEIFNYSIIVPVPPRKGKIKKKGWDQIDELCHILSRKYGYKCLNLLQRLSLEEQKKLNREERLKTIKKAYKLKEERELKNELNDCNGKLPESVCLIDDVCTTGATVECCSEILKEAGIKEVNVITLFIVD